MNPYNNIRKRHEVLMARLVALDDGVTNEKIAEAQESLHDELEMLADRWEIVSMIFPDKVEVEKGPEPISAFDVLKKIILSYDSYEEFIKLRDRTVDKDNNSVEKIIDEMKVMAKEEKKTLMIAREFLVDEMAKISELRGDLTPVPASRVASSAESTPQNSPKSLHKNIEGSVNVVGGDSKNHKHVPSYNS